MLQAARFLEIITNVDDGELEDLVVNAVATCDIREYVEEHQLFETRDYLQHCSREDLEKLAIQQGDDARFERWAMERGIDLPRLCGGAKTASEEYALYQRAMGRAS